MRSLAPLRSLSLVTAVLIGSHAMHAASPSMEGRLIGAMVYSADGAIVGEVTDFATSEGGSIDALRVRAGSPLGFGERIVVLPRGTFQIMRKGILLEFSAEALGALPSASTEKDSSEPN
jgi:PRC-barrel domain protein